jgi:hypothetical protein
MQLTLGERLEQFTHLNRSLLFERLESEVGTLCDQAKLLVSVVGMAPMSRHIGSSRGLVGRPSMDRQALATAFLAKAVYGLKTTRQVIERLRTDSQLGCLCGWNEARQIPHESRFSRACAEFSQSELPQRLHSALVEDTQKERLIGHIARDSTAIEARERFDTLPEHKAVPKRRRGRARKGEPLLPGRRLARQRRQSLAEMLSELPRHCSLGVKTKKGNQQYWRGYKLHIDVADGQIPVTCLLTAASLHDSQAAIPLATISAQRVTSLYDLMDSAYDASDIQQHSRSLGHIPLIAPNGAQAPIPPKVQDSLRRYAKRRKAPQWYPAKRPPFAPAQQERYKLRTMSERVNARLKDEFGGRHVRVRRRQGHSPSHVRCFGAHRGSTAASSHVKPVA